MSEDGDKPWEREDSRARSALAFMTILTVALAGAGGIWFWPTVPGGAVALLFISDRGQHRWLAQRFENMPPAYVIALSVGAHLLNNLSFCALAFGAGGPTWVHRDNRQRPAQGADMTDNAARRIPR